MRPIANSWTSLVYISVRYRPVIRDLSGCLTQTAAKRTEFDGNTCCRRGETTTEEERSLHQGRKYPPARFSATERVVDATKENVRF